MSEQTIKLDCVNPVNVSGVQNPITKAFINNAVVTYTVKDPSNHEVESGSCTYISASDGDYTGSFFADSSTFTQGVTYLITAIVMEGSDVILTPKRYAVAQYDIIPTPQTTPATTPYDTLDYATQLSAVRQAIYTILVGGQRATMGTVTYSYAELKELRALEKDLILRVAYSNGQYGMSVAQIDSPADRGGVNLGF